MVTRPCRVRTMRHSRLLIAVAIVVAATLPASVGAQPSAWPDCEGKDPDRAIAACSQIIKAGRERPQQLATAYRARAEAYRQKGQFERAIADYSEAIRLNPTYAVAFHERGSAYNAKGDSDKALADLNEAIRLDAKSAAAYTNRGRVYERQKKYDEAIADHDMAIKLNPKLAIAYANRGLAYEGKGDLTRALADFEAALAIDPKLERAIEGRKRVQSKEPAKQ